MALNITTQLSSSEGLMRIIYFEGLSHPIIIHSTVHEEPLLTTQAYYYLEQMESVATISYESEKNELTEKQLEYLIDNYLFELSKIDESSKVTTKAITGRYWVRDFSELYGLYDNRNTRALELDTLNEPGTSASSLDPKESIDFNDWCLVKNYSDHVFEEYVRKLGELIDKKIMIEAPPNDERNGYFGKARLVECEGTLLNHFQAMQLSNITPRDISRDPSISSLKLSNSYPGTHSVEIQKIKLTHKFNPILLSYYFAGLKESNPLLTFTGYYNVLEYYFEEAPRLCSITAKTELEQLNCVIEMLATASAISNFINNLSPQIKTAINAPIKTSSNMDISAPHQTGSSYTIGEISKWLYAIRCAIVHSKKTRRGAPTPSLNPDSDQIQNVSPSIPIIKWLSILCIEKDQALGFTQTI